MFCFALFACYEVLTRRRIRTVSQRAADMNAHNALSKNRQTFLSMVSVAASEETNNHLRLPQGSLLDDLFAVLLLHSCRVNMQVSHEVRTPASVIVSSAQIIQARGGLSEEGQQVGTAGGRAGTDGRKRHEGRLVLAPRRHNSMAPQNSPTHRSFQSSWTAPSRF